MAQVLELTEDWILPAINLHTYFSFLFTFLVSVYDVKYHLCILIKGYDEGYAD